MAELSRRSDVPVATIKYYLREGMLPPGAATGATRAVYDDHHVERLRLIRALVDVAGMSLVRVRGVLEVVDDDSRSLGAAIGSAHTQLSAEPTQEPTEESRRRVAALVRSRRWRADPDGRHGTALAAALDSMDAADQPMSDRTLAAYVDAASGIARADLAGMPDRSAADATTYAVIGTLLSEPVLIALRRMAQESVARRRWR